MAPNWAMGNSYGDDRRHSTSRGESYRPGERERPQAPRRDSRDGRYRNDTGDIRSPHETRNPREYRRDNEPSRPYNDANPNTNANPNPKIPDGPRKMTNHAVGGAPEKSSDELQFKRINVDKHLATNSMSGTAPAPVMPKAKNPELQDVFENAYNLGEKSNKRLLLSMRKKKAVQENAQRQLEKEKFEKSAKSYAPFIGQSNRFNTIDSTLDEQFEAADDDYRHTLERFVACLALMSQPPATNTQDPAIAVLEAKLEQVSQLMAEQTEQIQSLLKENKKYSALKSDHDALQLNVRALEDTILHLQSQHTNTDSENKSLRKQLEDLQSNTKENLKLSQSQLNELRNQFTKATEDLNSFKVGLENRITGIEAKLDDFTDYDDVKRKIDELDVVTVNEVCSTWVDNDLKTKLEEYSLHRQDDSSTQEAVRSLRQEVNSLQDSYAAISRPDKRIDLSMETIEAAISTKISAAEKSMSEDVEKLCQGRDDIYGGFIDDAIARIAVLEHGTPKHEGLEKRVQSLEEWKVEHTASVDRNQSPTLADRVTQLEGKKFGHRVDRIDLNVGDLNRKYETLAGKIVTSEWVDHRVRELFDGVHLDSINDAKVLQHKILAMENAIKTIEHATRTLDGQFQNLSTKQLAENIVQLANPGIEQRLGRLESKTNHHDGIVSRHTDQLGQFLDLVRAWKPGEKRTASPSHLDEPSKRRRLETNGRHPSPLQQQQQLNSPSRHPSA
ncbi:hypothetical protein GQX73_g6449 [Xylaria multiplex]|uniref:Uncharacterized protein n=1 Tax=Xylaria multiplex TaxID=323545 RepID=A0A7C8MKJ6_9PEZI|nr:hypothetical protein GQX73_g6449 [Xylaria multiplex]